MEINNDYKLIDVTVDSMKILSCIKRMGENYSASIICSVLKGIKSRKILDLKFDNLSTFGIMRGYSRRYILNLINNLQNKGYINYDGKYSIISLKREAYNILFNGEKIYYKEYFNEPYVYYDKTLFSLLKIVIDNISLKYGISSDILSYKTIKEICIQYPLNKTSLIKIKGISDEVVNKYGDIILDNIENYIRNNDVDIHKYHDINIKNGNKNKSDSFMISCNLYNDGMSIEEITNIRGFTKDTILTHLLMGYQSGIIDNLDNVVNIQYKDAIYEAIEKYSSEGLKAVKDALPEAVTYFDIRYFLYELEK